MKSKHKNQRNRKGKRGKGWLTSLSCMPARGEKRGLAGGTARRDPATGAPRPGRSTAVRSPAGERARRRGGRRRRQGSTDSPLESLGAAVAALRKERKRAAKTESGEGRMALGFKGAAAVAVLILRCARTAVGWRGTAEMEWAKSQPRRARGRAGHCRPRPRLRPGCGLCARKEAGPRVAGPVALLWAEIAEQ